MILDEAEQTVKVADQLFELTAMEFRLLKIFLMSPKKLLSKTQLTDKLYQFDDEKRVMWSRFMQPNLRKKLGKPLSKPVAAKVISSTALLNDLDPH